jgi:hypothetical protein
MRKYNALCFALLLGLAILAAPITASAECIDVTPASWDYGDVEVGTSESQIITIHSCGATALNIGYLEVIKDETGAPSFAYEITSPIPDVPFSLQGSAHPDFPEGETLEIEVTFTPPDIGTHDAILYIRHDADGGETSINLYGAGVPEEPEPGEVMAELIDFFETSVDAGTLAGDGPGSSASGRLKAFRNMLNAANDHIEDGNYALACEQLQDARNRVDGLHPPPDFVVGPARAEVEAMIAEVMAELGCP